LVTVDSKEKGNANIREELRFKKCALHKHFPDECSISYLRICWRRNSIRWSFVPLGVKNFDKLQKKEKEKSMALQWLLCSVITKEVKMFSTTLSLRCNLNCTHHTRKQAAVLAVGAYWIPKA